MNGTRLSPITKNQLDEVMAVEKAAYPIPWTYGAFYDCLLAKYDCHALWLDDELLGYFVAQTVTDELHVLNICVSPAQQGKGWGQYLLKTIITMAQTRSFRRVLLEVRVSNTHAQRLYLNCGFVEIGRRKKYYPAVDGREDGIVMALPL